MEAATREHVPPKCIFPESKDLKPGVNYRKNLITVPSCAEHNLRKSGDDEYLLFTLVANFDVNTVGLQQWATKLRRSMRKRQSKMGIFRNLKPIIHLGVVTGIYEIDKERLEQYFELICRGIYYSIFGEPWSHDIQIALPFAFSGGPNTQNVYNEATSEVVRAERNFLVYQKRIGDNPKVFYYQLMLKEDGPGFIFRLVFYEGIEVFGSSDPEFIKPNSN